MSDLDLGQFVGVRAFTRNVIFFTTIFIKRSDLDLGRFVGVRAFIRNVILFTTIFIQKVRSGPGWFVGVKAFTRNVIFFTTGLWRHAAAVGFTNEFCHRAKHAQEFRLTPQENGKTNIRQSPSKSNRKININE